MKKFTTAEIAEIRANLNKGIVYCGIRNGYIMDNQPMKTLIEICVGCLKLSLKNVKPLPQQNGVIIISVMCRLISSTKDLIIAQSIQMCLDYKRRI